MSTTHTHESVLPTTTAPTTAQPEIHEKRGLFGRNKKTAPIAATRTNETYVAGQTGGTALGGTEYAGKGPYGHGFTFGRWIKLNMFDLITMAAMGAIGLGVFEADPAPRRNFPVYTPTTGEVVYPQFAYPYRHNIIPIYAAALLAFFVPFVFFVLFQIRHRSPGMLLDSTMGLLESLITAAVFQVFHKWLIGGLRPHFLDVCQPDFSRQTGTGFANYMYTRDVCTGDEGRINEALQSWMSGHSTAIFAGLVYLALWFNAQLKVMSDHRPAYWKMILAIAPILGASLIAASLTIDEYHNWYDCLGGAVTGTFCAFIAYRKTFAAIFDFRFNHIVLPRTTSLFGRKSVAGQPLKFGYNVQEALYQRPAASEGGWGKTSQEYIAGAPGDAVGMGQHQMGGNVNPSLMHPHQHGQYATQNTVV